MRTGLKKTNDTAALPAERKTPETRPEDWPAKLRFFWRRTLEAGERQDRLSLLGKVQGMFLEYHLGAARGWVKGVAGSLGDLINPRSDFYDPDTEVILEDLRGLPETLLDHGIDYMEADWMHRGEMNGEQSVRAGIWLIKVLLGAKTLGQGLVKGLKKL